MKRQVVICVDDEIVVLESLRTELREALGSDYLVEVAESGQEALELVEDLLAEGHEIPLVISDYIMPGMKGDELLQHIHQRSPRTLNILLTGQASIEAVTHAIHYARLYRYIAKPWEATDLQLTVTEAINSYLQDQKLAAQHLKLLELNQALEAANHTLEQKVAERTQELSQALANLQSAQESLIQAEKLAALGQLVAGVAHEINTPMSAISTSIQLILKSMERSLDQLPHLFQTVHPEQLTDFYLLLDLARQPRPTLSSREERQARRALSATLEAAGYADAPSLAAQLIELGVKELESVRSLLDHPQRDLILETVYTLTIQKSSSETIQLAVGKAAKIIFALKSYIHPSTSKEPIRASLKEGIEIVLTIYHNNLKHGIEVIKQYQAVPDLLCYPDQLQQVWTNLIHNAIQAMNGQGTLEINLFQQQQEVVVQFTDSGCGVPEAIQAKIFDPFFTTKPPGEGSGLGLSITRQILDRHQGRITVESQPGRTTFSVYLPLFAQVCCSTKG